jgi:hypothetical protein
MKKFLCTVLLVIGLATVSLAQQKVMTITAVGNGASNKLYVHFPGQPSEVFDLRNYSYEPSWNGTHQLIADKLQEYLNKGWRLFSQSSTSGMLNLSISYTLVKDE